MHPAYDADIEAALDTSDEMSVGDALRRRRGHKDKRSIARRTAKAVAAMRPPARRSSALAVASADEMAAGVVAIEDGCSHRRHQACRESGARGVRR